ncbi:LuxR family transcriptional regulator [Melioribacter roseus P3M-2]|uniref:LuxR family transcriptional regulator n=1 Tax=Melioribacter roseus (strain DSM 23840 / JCM 17771 / VKM B-2668 / P3M-2) TaxID=1191523 RepID=I7A030_MELRP|nr:GIY-YIG nuclease family protein [Melioribacter roseus]AFN74608.1 LuxR family transcriptional regulator [Melioribacter roseus P3M-2]
MDKSALKKAYKESKKPMGVYSIKNNYNHKLYLGASVDPEARINRHKAELRFGSHRNAELQNAWKNGGESALEFEILDLLEQKEEVENNIEEELRLLTEMWIQKLKDGDYEIILIN